MFCDLLCEEDMDPANVGGSSGKVASGIVHKHPIGVNSDLKCGGWGFMSVTHKPVPAAPVHSVITYKGCYDVKENPDIFKTLVAKSDWMTNEVQWRPCTLCRQLELSFCTSQAARVRCILTEVSRVMGAGTKSRTPRGSTTTFVCPSAQS